MHIHTNTLRKPKQTKENKKVQEDDPANKRNQKLISTNENQNQASKQKTKTKQSTN